jgi:hypothetical protein
MIGGERRGMIGGGRETVRSRFYPTFMRKYSATLARPNCFMINGPHAQPDPAISEPYGRKTVANEITASNGWSKKGGAKLTVQGPSNDPAPCGKRG